ncbi:MAG TPA: molybdopterin cofactor-binding domain-containing protein, partial [Salinisphaeraceae bacterium]|nr:molybdopterin cofactor-binding domain-containing protein [Salinisphaeraceae bacterium]
MNEHTPKSNPSVNVPFPHDSAHKHVNGEARFGDDIPEPQGLLHAYARPAERTHARIISMDLAPVRAFPGVKAVVAAADLHATSNDIGTAFPGDLVFADGEVQYHGQPLFAVAADSRATARRAAMQAKIEYEDLPAILTIDEALAAQAEVRPTKEWVRGEPERALAHATHRLSGRTFTGEQEQFYLEGQVATAIPQEDGDMLVHCSTQGPSGDQRKIAKVMGVADHAVTVENRRMGGGF